MAAVRSSGADRRRRSDGERSRAAILDAAARLATTDGLEGLTISRLADHVGMSKSGLFAHFGSKEELQLATIETANEIYCEVVVRPALAAPTGLERIEALCERFLDHVRVSVFPGGCFFASVAAEMDTRTGPVRDRAAEIVAWWMTLLIQALDDAKAEGDIAQDSDTVQLAFELQAFLLLANAAFTMGGGDATALERGQRAIEHRLALARTTG